MRTTMPVTSRAVLVAAIVALGFGSASPTPAAAAATFGEPTTSFAYGEEIVFEQPVDLAGPIKRAEILIETPGALGPLAEPVDAAGAGRTTLRYTWDVGEDFVVPNTTFTARWRLTRPDGSVELGPSTSVRYADTRFDWQTRSGDLVTVHWYEGSPGFGERALSIGEEAVRTTAELLGVTESDPVDFFVYADQDAFYDALGPGTRENVGGQAHADIRTLFALIDPGQIDDPWVSIVIPHELVHLVFDTAVTNPYHYPLHWLNEGLAVYLSEGYGTGDRSAVEAAARGGTLMPLDGLSGQFPTSREQFFLAYSESVSAVDFLIREHGEDALVRLVRSYGAGVSDDEAFEAALGVDTAGFDAAWRAGLGAGEPVAHGPQPAPPGPVPPGWEQGSPAPSAPGPSLTPGAPVPTPPSGSLSPVDLTLAIVAVVLVVGVGGAIFALRRDRSRRKPEL